ncbi:aryl-sulfate sulfotransferase [Agrobacterium rhizogenes]|uniref:ribbon-helix-helix domain-containing protein n=1 Tax=Rhizobium rhizogenes TaxID=359 RepID=UPI00157305F6|nr:ribbon-helix-helix domain-containing protein [Rhizobium rhizogenes]NTH14234.1 aryl-sulfate sulfotransferase [Rhizobium rhizogenes]
MNKLFEAANAEFWELELKSVRMNGACTSIRLEKLFWCLLNEIASCNGLSLSESLDRLRDVHDEFLHEHGKSNNFTSFLRVACGRYLMLQRASDISRDVSSAIEPHLDQASRLKAGRFVATSGRGSVTRR